MVFNLHGRSYTCQVSQVTKYIMIQSAHTVHTCHSSELAHVEHAEVVPGARFHLPVLSHRQPVRSPPDALQFDCICLCSTCALLLPKSRHLFCLWANERIAQRNRKLAAGDGAQLVANSLSPSTPPPMHNNPTVSMKKVANCTLLM